MNDPCGVFKKKHLWEHGELIYIGDFQDCWRIALQLEKLFNSGFKRSLYGFGVQKISIEAALLFSIMNGLNNAD